MSVETDQHAAAHHNYGGDIMETKIQVLIADPGEDARQLLTDMLSR